MLAIDMLHGPPHKIKISTTITIYYIYWSLYNELWLFVLFARVKDSTDIVRTTRVASISYHVHSIKCLSSIVAKNAQFELEAVHLRRRPGKSLEALLRSCCPTPECCVLISIDFCFFLNSPAVFGCFLEKNAEGKESKISTSRYAK